MSYDIYKFIFFFFIYAFLGWGAQEVYAIIKYRRFVNRGFINGPVSLKSGFCMAAVIFITRDLWEYPVFQLIASVGIVLVGEYLSGVLIRVVTGKQLWDYSKKKWNIGKYTSFLSALGWGTICACALWFVHPVVYILYDYIPISIIKITLIVLIVLLFIDLFVTVSVALKWKLDGHLYGNVARSLKNTKNGLGKALYEYVKKRMCRAFPEFDEKQAATEEYVKKSNSVIFAKGLCFNKLVWIFIVSAIVGDLVETVFVWATTGVLMSRSSLIYAPLSVVWGLGGAIGTAMLYPLKDKPDRYIFIGGFFLGGIYEYACSVFTEVVFGTVYWDYSHIPYNINGRVNLLYCFFWGVAAIVWVKLLYPFASRIIEKIPAVLGTIATWCIIAFVVLDAAISGIVVSRYVERKTMPDLAPSNYIESFVDNTYTDALVERVYPNMKIK